MFTAEGPPMPAMFAKAGAEPGTWTEHIGKVVLLLAAMKWLEYTIQQQYGGGPVFDFRMGYTPEEARGALSTWGSIGRFLFLVIEAIDTFAFIGLVRAMFGRFYKTYLGDVDWVNLSPIFSLTAYSDLLENMAQVLMTLLFEARMGSMPWFSAVAQVGSAANIVKWYAMGFGVFLIGLLFAFKFLGGTFPALQYPTKMRPLA
jgi:hypothetical protein